MTIIGGIEAGGTKFVCATGTEDGKILARVQFPTTTPDETIGKAIAFFREQPELVKSIGIASFGPVDLHPGSETFGYITSTPKPGWSHINLAGQVKSALNLPIAFDTDVNGAALGEQQWGAAQGLDSFIYLTIGTGIGGGGMVGGELIHGLLHPEVGHIRIPHDRSKDPFEGICPFHKDCLEGLANGPAIEQRWGQRGETIPESHPAWDLEAEYLAYGLTSFILTLSPQRIIMGGGVMQPHLFPLVRKNVLELLNGYVQHEAILNSINDYIVPPALGNNAGVLGAIALGIGHADH